MSFDPLVALPAGYITGQAIAYATAADHAVLVSAATPLPVTSTRGAATSTMLAGTTAASVAIGPFVPELGRPVWLTLSGSWAGSVQLLRSIDGGTTKLPITWPDGSARGTYTGNLNAAVVEESCSGATWYLAVTLSSGTLSYRMAQ